VLILPELGGLAAGVLLAASLTGRVFERPLARFAVSDSSATAAKPSSFVPPFKRGLGRIGAASLFSRVRESSRLAQRLIAAGSRLTPDEFVGVKVVCAFCSVGVLLLGATGFIALPLVALAAFRLPDFFIGRSLRRRRGRLDSEVPQLLDVLAAGTSAGLSAQLAIERSVPALRGPLADELRSLVDAVSLGSRWRTELADLSARVKLPDLRRAANAITRTEMLGVSLADTLRDLASDVRSGRRAVATEKARKAPVKMLFPLVFMVLPACLLLTVVPVLLSTLRSIS
jgi:tight adherence protein C